jgi:hypothetical protein
MLALYTRAAQEIKSVKRNIHMTQQEHSLMIAMFTRQAMVLQMLAEILRSRGIMESSDPAAFDFLVRQKEKLDPKALRLTSGLYQELAKTVGLDIDITGFEK